MAAARSRSRWVLAEGCPVLAVHFSFGLAPHIGQRTDNIRFSVIFPGFAAMVFSMVGLRDGQSCSGASRDTTTGIGISQPILCAPEKLLD